MKITPDDPKLTAYALGELDEAERKSIEAEMNESAECRRTVEEIRQTATLLTDELASEELPELNFAQQHSIEAKLKPRTEKAQSPVWWKVLFYGAATACVLVLAAGLLLPVLSKAKFKAHRTDSARAYDPYEPNLQQESLSQPYDNKEAETPPVVTVNTPPPPSSQPTPQTMPPQIPIPEAQRRIFVERYGLRPRTLSEGTGGKGKIDKFDTTTRLRSTFQGHFNTESYDRIQDNPFLAVAQNPLSTFSIDVDTASYSMVRRFLSQGQLPPKDAVRIEELVNYFTYRYSQPKGTQPFSVNVEVAGCPWNAEHRLARVGLKGREIANEKRPPSNLVFLIDVSGSMQPENKLPLLKRALKLLVNQLAENDRVAIVVYAGNSGLVLSSTSGDQKDKILAALDQLEAGGSTNGGEGIGLAYLTAMRGFIKGGVNRVILCTDGDFNVGVTNQGDLIRMIEEKAKSGIFLSVFGFGMGNYKDSTLEKLADKGNGNYGYIDTFSEARKVFVEQMSGTLVTIAKDVKIQVEFNPAQVAAYRLIGYENRLLAKEDFNDDKKDAGEIGAGHTVTALYEIVPARKSVPIPKVDPLKYQPAPDPESKTAWSSELMNVKLRYKAPEGDTSKLIEVPVTDGEKSYARASEDFKFAAAVASFGMVLRESEFKGTSSLDGVLELAEEGRGQDESGYRVEFIQLIKQAKALRPPSYK